MRRWTAEPLRKWRPHKGPAAWLITSLFLASSGLAQQTPRSPSQVQPATAPQVIIPDGTPVQLRFTQPVRGKVRLVANAVPEAKPNDTVRLVVAADVRINNLVVFAKGTLGQLTVVRVWRPFMVLTGLSLRFEFVEDVTGQRVPLRGGPQGEPEAFDVQVLSTYGGMIARPETLRGDLIGKDAVDISIAWRKKAWIPAGTRIQAFVQGTVTRDLADVSEAQALLPISTDAATLTVYRTKGQGDTYIRLRCDGKEFGQIGARQYTTLELQPGKHVCQAEQSEALEIVARAGEDYFLQLKGRAMTGGWELKPVDTAEGEDDIAHLELVSKQ